MLFLYTLIDNQADGGDCIQSCSHVSLPFRLVIMLFSSNKHVNDYLLKCFVFIEIYVYNFPCILFLVRMHLESGVGHQTRSFNNNNKNDYDNK